jgi:hypothetical protein
MVSKKEKSQTQHFGCRFKTARKIAGLGMERTFTNPVAKMKVASLSDVEAASEKTRKTWNLG